MPPQRVLIVDDHRELRRALRAGLLTLNPDLEIIDVPSAEEALLVISRHAVDLMVLDVRLPGISGLELQARLRQHDQITKLILITGVTEAKTRQMVSESGADAVFFKPIQMDKFLEAAGHFLNLEISAGAQEDSGSIAELNNLTTLMSDFLEAFSPTGLIVFDESGNKLAEVGRINELELLPGLSEAIRQIAGDTRKISDLLGIEAPETILRFEGGWNYLFLTLIGASRRLLVAVPKGIPPEQVIRLQTAMWNASRRLNAWLTETQNPALEIISPSIENTADLAASDLESETHPEFERLFDQQGVIDANRSQAENFWEMPAELDNPVLPGENGVITYEEALRRGLAPGTDEAR